MDIKQNNGYNNYIGTFRGVKMARILISMRDNFLESIDELAQKENRTRSELVREALRNYIKRANMVSPKKAQDNAIILENLLD